MSALKNLSSLKRSITRRIREALEELQENLGNLGNLERQPVPVRIPVPVRRDAPFRGRGPLNFYRALKTAPGKRSLLNSPLALAQTVAQTEGFSRGFCSFPKARGSRYLASRFFATYNLAGACQSLRRARINQLVLFHNFSSKSQFRLEAFHRFYGAPSLTQFLRKMSAFPMALVSENSSLSKNKTMPVSLRLSLLLSHRFHDMVRSMAAPASDTAETGCYVDFSLLPRILIPSATILSAEILGELLENLKRFERLVALLQLDLLKVAALGELPLRVVAAEGVIRVFFPNCDRARVENLLVEKNVRGGIIHEDADGLFQLLQHNETTGLDLDVLSSGSSVPLALPSSGRNGDILSLSGASSTHSRPVSSSPGHSGFADDYIWA